MKRHSLLPRHVCFLICGLVQASADFLVQIEKLLAPVDAVAVERPAKIEQDSADHVGSVTLIRAVGSPAVFLPVKYTKANPIAIQNSSRIRFTRLA